jgi:hypothetical protein
VPGHRKSPQNKSQTATRQSRAHSQQRQTKKSARDGAAVRLFILSEAKAGPVAQASARLPDGQACEPLTFVGRKSQTQHNATKTNNDRDNPTRILSG